MQFYDFTKTKEMNFKWKSVSFVRYYNKYCILNISYIFICYMYCVKICIWRKKLKEETDDLRSKSKWSGE